MACRFSATSGKGHSEPPSFLAVTAELPSIGDAGEAWRGPRRSATSPRRQVLPNDRTLRLTGAAPAPGQSTKSLRDSPLRGGKSREAVASREESDGESTRSPRSTSLLLQRSTLDQAHQVDLRPVSDAAMARCWNDKMALTNSANQVA